MPITRTMEMSANRALWTEPSKADQDTTFTSLSWMIGAPLAQYSHKRPNLLGDWADRLVERENRNRTQ